MKTQLLTPKVGETVNLQHYDPSYAGGVNKEAAQAELVTLQERIKERQDMMYAQGKYALLIILQGMDTSGKDGTIKHVFDAVNPLGLRIAAFKSPTALELSHDFLWRVHQQVPPKSYIGIFNRSHYEDVLIVRVNNLVDETVWSKRYEHINAFEALLSDSGTRILKFFLHISKDEQKERLEARLANPDKWFKFSKGDLPVRERWDDYMAAYEALLTRCNTPAAPWHIVPANRKWYRDYIITQAIVMAMDDMPLEYPIAEEGLDKIVIPD